MKYLFCVSSANKYLVILYFGIIAEAVKARLFLATAGGHAAPRLRPQLNRRTRYLTPDDILDDHISISPLLVI